MTTNFNTGIISNNYNVFAVRFKNSGTIYYITNASNELYQIASIGGNGKAGIDFIKRESAPLQFKNISKSLVKQLFCSDVDNDTFLTESGFIK